MAEPSPSDRFSSAFQQLLPAAAKLDAASNGLTKPVAEIEAILKRLNLGISSWTTLTATSGDEDGNGGEEWSLGYARHGGRWGILVRFWTGNTRTGDGPDEHWFFADCPRFMKAKAIDKLPDLIEGLVALADKTADKLARKTATAQELADAVKPLVERKK